TRIPCALRLKMPAPDCLARGAAMRTHRRGCRSGVRSVRGLEGRIGSEGPAPPMRPAPCPAGWARMLAYRPNRLYVPPVSPGTACEWGGWRRRSDARIEALGGGVGLAVVLVGGCGAHSAERVGWQRPAPGERENGGLSDDGVRSGWRPGPGVHDRCSGAGEGRHPVSLPGLVFGWRGGHTRREN